MKDVSQLRELSMEELLQKERDLRQELFNFKFQHSIHQLEDVSKIRQVRRRIARVKTIIREKELAAV